MIDKFTFQLVIHVKSSRFKGHTIYFLLTNQSQVHPKRVTEADVIGTQSHIELTHVVNKAKKLPAIRPIIPFYSNTHR